MSEAPKAAGKSLKTLSGLYVSKKRAIEELLEDE
jgi:hypothetical protein